MADSPSDFCILNGSVDSRLSDVERLTMVGGRGLDRVLGRLAKSLGQVSLQSYAPSLNFALLRERGQYLQSLRDAGRLEVLFEKPSVTHTPEVTQVHGFPDGAVFDLKFASPFPNPTLDLDPNYKLIEENASSFVRLWSHSDSIQERLTVVGIHGWTMGDQRANSLAFLPGILYRLGFDVALVELPFHGRRMPIKAGIEGPLFPSVDPVRTCIAIAHALYDLRVLRSYLESKGAKRVATVGMSLGAYVGAVWASRDVLDKALFLVPMFSMGDMAWSLVSSGGEVNGIDRDFLKGLYQDHCPYNTLPATPQNQMLVIGGEGDHLVPTAQISELQSKWTDVRLRWVRGGHSAVTNREDTFLEIVRFLTNNPSDSDGVST